MPISRNKNEAEEEPASPPRKGGGLRWVVLGVFVLLAFLIFNPFVFVNAGTRGVLLEFGQAKATLPEGLAFKVPFIQDIKVMDVQTQKYSTTAAAASSDLQTVTTTIAVNYHIQPDLASQIYKDVGVAYADRLIVPAVQEATKASTAKFTAEELITKRNDMKQIILEELSKRLLPYGIMVETISIENFDFSASFNSAIEAKVTQEQMTLTAQRKLEQIKYEAEQAVAAANGVAEAKLKVATAEAQAIQIQGEALQKSPQVVSLRYIEKWNGKLPNVMLGGSNSMTLMQLPESTVIAEQAID